MIEKYRPELTPGAKRLLKLFEGSVIICMGVVIMSGILSIYGAQKEFEAFDGNCIFTSNISFISRVGSTPKERVITSTLKVGERYRRAEPYTEETPVNTSIETTKPSLKGGSHGGTHLKHIYKSLQSHHIDSEDDFDDEIQVNIPRETDITRGQVATEKDYIFLSTMQVDVVKTVWVSISFCDYVLYTHVLSIIIGMVCTTMLVLYNTAGKAHLDWGIPKPWRIVFPAAITFGIMTIVSIIHFVITNDAYDEFCTGLASELKTKTLACKKLISAFQPMANVVWISAGNNYVVHTVNMRLTLAAWLIAFVVMLARMFFAIDFRLVRGTISTFSQKRLAPAIESSSSESVEVEQKPESLDENAAKLLDVKTDRSASSREDMDEFQSAHSDPDGTVAQPTSLDPLLPGQTQSKERSNKE